MTRTLLTILAMLLAHDALTGVKRWRRRHA